MGGKDAARVLLDLDPAARLIVSSGYSSDPVLANPAEYGFQGVLGKPYRVADLVKVVQTVLAGGDSRR
jgi:DNA-binding NarL/FixJ family response regulator